MDKQLIGHAIKHLHKHITACVSAQAEHLEYTL